MTTEGSAKKRQGERNPGASIQQRLRNYARFHKSDPSLVLMRYVIERFLYRLSQSPYRNQFILRGATLFTAWAEVVHRPTRDLDLMGIGNSTADFVKSSVQEVLATEVPEDGIQFLLETLIIEERTAGRAYPGLYLEVTATVGTSRSLLHVDLSFGEAVTPMPEVVAVPSLLSFPPSMVLAYTRETVIAEKSEAMVSLGLYNTRLKDFFDIWYLSQTVFFDGVSLATALKATFDRRGTSFPANGVPVALTEEFSSDVTKQLQWNAFLKRAEDHTAPQSLKEATDAIHKFLTPLFLACVDEDLFQATWDKEGWTRKDT